MLGDLAKTQETPKRRAVREARADLGSALCGVVAADALAGVTRFVRQLQWVRARAVDAQQRCCWGEGTLVFIRTMMRRAF